MFSLQGKLSARRWHTAQRFPDAVCLWATDCHLGAGHVFVFLARSRSALKIFKWSRREAGAAPGRSWQLRALRFLPRERRLRTHGAPWPQLPGWVRWEKACDTYFPDGCALE